MKVFLPCLALCLAVVFSGLAFVMRPQPGRVQRPVHLASEAHTVLAARIEPAPPARETAPAPAVIPPRPRPAPPDVINDPAKGTLVFRLIDEQTNQPLADKACEYWCCDQSDGSLFANEHSEFERKADAQGLVVLSVETRSMEGADDDGTSGASSADVPARLCDMRWLPWIIACGYEPADTCEDLIELLAPLQTAPASAPVDLLMRRAVELCGRVQDSAGRPVQGVTVVLWPAHEDSGTLSESLLKRRGLELGVLDFESCMFDSLARATSLPVMVAAPGIDRDREYLPKLCTSWSAVSCADGTFRIRELYGERFTLGAFAPGFSDCRELTKVEAALGLTLVTDGEATGVVELEVRWMDEEMPEELGYTLRLHELEDGNNYNPAHLYRYCNVKSGGSRVTKLSIASLKPARYEVRMADDRWE